MGYAFFSNDYGIFMKIDHIQGHVKKPNKFQRMKIIQSELLNINVINQKSISIKIDKFHKVFHN